MANGVIIERTDAKDVREKNIRVLDIFLRLLRKIFRVACNTLNEMFCFWADTEKETRAASLASCTTDRQKTRFRIPSSF